MQQADTAFEGHLKLLYAFPVYTQAGDRYPWHGHDYHELVYMQNGRFHAQAQDFEHTAVPGDILLYTAGTQHEEYAEKQTDVTTLACMFEYDGFQPDEPILRRDISGKVQKLLTDLCSLYIFNELHEDRTHNCLPVLQALLHEMERLKPNSHQAMVDKVRAYVQVHLAETLTVDDLAQCVGLTRSRFTQLYHAATGVTPWNEIQRIRIEEAKRLITTTSLPLHAIAPRVGINSEYHLSKLIKSILGVGARGLRSAKD